MNPGLDRAQHVTAIVVSAIAATAAGLWAHVQNAAVAVGLFSTVCGGAALILGMLVRKIIRDREDEREKKEDVRQQQLSERLRSIERELYDIRTVAQKALIQYDNITSAVAAMKADLSADILDNRSEIRRAHDRLESGRGSISKLRADIAGLGGGRSPGRDDDR